MPKKIKEKITKDTIIGEIFEKYPDRAAELAQILMEKGFHCFGCAYARFETLEQGIKSHGWGKEQLKKLLKELNECLEKK